jgi:hypothetical protein
MNLKQISSYEILRSQLDSLYEEMQTLVKKVPTMVLTNSNWV